MEEDRQSRPASLVSLPHRSPSSSTNKDAAVANGRTSTPKTSFEKLATSTEDAHARAAEDAAIKPKHRPSSSKPANPLPPLGPVIAKRVQQSIRLRNRDWRPSPTSIRKAATLAPLFAALMAPLSTLLDIPALTQRWYTLNGVDVEDFAASLVLSAVGLAANLIANGLLIARFSKWRWWKLSSHLSLVGWIIKTILALANVSYYGARARNGIGYVFTEGFWCAVASVILAGIITLILIFHAVVEVYKPASQNKDAEDPEQVRMTGKRFMLSVVALTIIISVEALIFSRIESWTFLDGCYFAIVTGFTIGLGDFTPTRSATKVLLFPFAIISITYLANQVSMIISFVGERAELQKAHWRAQFEDLQQRKADERNPHVDLVEQMYFLEAVAAREEFMSQLYDLLWSVLALVLLWTLGAIAFALIEGWGYGDAFYFVYVVLLTIGYGDFAPTTPGGRVFFIIFALASVPVITSFAVQTVQGLLGAYANRRMDRKEKSIEEQKHRDAFTPHADWILDHTKRIDSRIDSYTAEHEKKAESDDTIQRDLHAQLAVAVLDCAIRLEGQARMLLIGQMKDNSREQTLLRADQHVQLRVRAALESQYQPEGVDESTLQTIHDKAKHWRLINSDIGTPSEARQPGQTAPDALEQIRDYRKESFPPSSA